MFLFNKHFKWTIYTNELNRILLSLKTCRIIHIDVSKINKTFHLKLISFQLKKKYIKMIKTSRYHYIIPCRISHYKLLLFGITYHNGIISIRMNIEVLQYNNNNIMFVYKCIRFVAYTVNIWALSRIPSSVFFEIGLLCERVVYSKIHFQCDTHMHGR